MDNEGTISEKHSQRLFFCDENGQWFGNLPEIELEIKKDCVMLLCFFWDSQFRYFRSYLFTH